MVSFSECQQKLSQLRKSGEHNSHVALYYGNIILKDYSGKLGNEVWAVYEQVFLAALDRIEENRPLAEKCLKALQSKFGLKSFRVRRLEGMLHEANGDFSKALAFYDQALESDPNNVPLAKRKIALLKAQGNIAEAIKELNSFVDTYMLDVEAWKELTELYLSQQMYSSAAHCLEELILLSPHNHLAYLKYAMTLYTMGGAENLNLARAYFCKVLDLNKDNTRALIGLKMTCQALANRSAKSTATPDSVTAKLSDFASSRLEEKFESAPKALKDAAVAALDSLSAELK